MPQIRTTPVPLDLIAEPKLSLVPPRPARKCLKRIIGAGLRAPSDDELAQIRGPQRDVSHKAAQYIRMSTDLQQYSTANQLDAIAAYATRNGLEVVRTYTDDGKSGLNVRDREGLCQLLHDVIGGTPPFGVVLVYDVSRWGRFQDIDEAAHYEYLCRRAGIRVEYCAEPFSNDGTPMAAVIKGLKRVMAGEYSRELSEKVYWAKCRLIRKGFRQGGIAGFGLRRMVIDAAGNPRGIIRKGQYKYLQTDRVVLVPGPQEELDILKWIFEQVAKGNTPTPISRELNRRGVQCEDGRPWNYNRVRCLLSNEKYIGTSVFNRTSVKLKSRLVFNPPEKWIRVEKAFAPAVDPKLFYRAQAAMDKWNTRLSNEQALDLLRKLYKRRRRLTERMVEEAPGLPGIGFYCSRFGGMTRAYALVGFVPKRNYAYLDGNRQRRARIRQFRGEVYRALLDCGGVGEWECDGILKVMQHGRVWVTGARCVMRGTTPIWHAQSHSDPKPDWVLVERWRVDDAIHDYCLLRGGNNVFLGVTPHRYREKHFADNYEALLQLLVSGQLDSIGERLSDRAEHAAVSPNHAIPASHP